MGINNISQFFIQIHIWVKIKEEVLMQMSKNMNILDVNNNKLLLIIIYKDG